MNRVTAARDAAASKPKPICLRFIVFMPFLWHARQRRARRRERIDLAQREPSAALIALHAAPLGSHAAACHTQSRCLGRPAP
jgi:hypothetical protein